MATLRYRFETLGAFRGALGGQVDASAAKPLGSGTLAVGPVATAPSAQPQAPVAGDGLVLTLVAIDAAVYVDVGAAPDPTAEPRHLVLPGTPVRVHVSSGDRLSAVLAGDVPGATASALPFVPLRPQTYALTAGPAATGTPLQLPAVAGATSYRVRNPAASASPVTWSLSTSSGTVPVISTPSSTAGTGGGVGEATIDPGGVEVFGLSGPQQAALAGGALYWSAITPSGGSAVLAITFGTGG